MRFSTDFSHELFLALYLLNNGPNEILYQHIYFFVVSAAE